jgi:hypothetical protein
MARLARRFTAHRTASACLLLGLLAVQLSCLRSGSDGSRAKGFGWDEGLAPLETSPAEGRGAPPDTWDKKFCKDRRPGACFSLVIRVPRSELIQDIGLSVLALGASSRDMRARLDEACQAAWTEYRQKYLFDSLHPKRRKFVQSVEKMRCIYRFMGEEVASEDTELAKNEIAFSARLTKFELLGDVTDATASHFGVRIQNKAVQTQFRSVYVYGGTDVQPGAGGWQPAVGLGAAPIAAKRNMERSIQWRVDHEALLKNLEKVASDPAAAQTAIGSFITQAKDQLAAVASAANPLSSSVLLIGMGYNAYRSVCGENRDLCKLSSEQTSMTGDVSQDLADLVPSSETNELFRLATIRTIQSVLDEIFVRLDPEQLQQSFRFN